MIGQDNERPPDGAFQRGGFLDKVTEASIAMQAPNEDAAWLSLLEFDPANGEFRETSLQAEP